MPQPRNSWSRPPTPTTRRWEGSNLAPRARGALATALVIAETIHKMPFEVNLWQAQNIWNDLLRRSDMNYWSAEWKENFKETRPSNEHLVRPAGPRYRTQS